MTQQTDRLDVVREAIQDVQFIRANFTKQYINRMERGLIEDLHKRLWSIEAALSQPAAHPEPDNVKVLKPGHYILHWTEERGGGSSMAVVGIMHNGKNWYACANWTSDNYKFPTVASTDWDRVERAEAALAKPAVKEIDVDGIADLIAARVEGRHGSTIMYDAKDIVKTTINAALESSRAYLKLSGQKED